jgi:hypothetical protein
MPGIVRGTPAPPPSRTGPTNQYGQPLTEYEQQQQKTQAGNTNLDRGAQNFYSGANRGVNYDMSYTDPRTGLSMNYKAQPTFGAQMSNFSQFMNKFGNLGGSGSSTSSGRGGLSGADQPRVQLDTNAIAEGDNAAFSPSEGSHRRVDAGADEVLAEPVCRSRAPRVEHRRSRDCVGC